MKAGTSKRPTLKPRSARPYEPTTRLGLAINPSGAAMAAHLSTALASRRPRGVDHFGGLRAPGGSGGCLTGQLAVRGGTLLLPVWRIGLLAFLQLAPHGRHGHFGNLHPHWRFAR